MLFRSTTDTEKEAIVKHAEALCRASMEYSDYIAYLRANVGMDACAFFNNISKSNNKKIQKKALEQRLHYYGNVEKP